MGMAANLLLNYLFSLVAADGSRVSQLHCEKSQVLILGAGMTGISAGAALSNAGITDIKIIEYQDRIGGRTLSSEFGSRAQDSSWKVELGTNWIVGLHEANGSIPDQGKVNPIWTLAEEVNLTTLISDPRPELYDESGRYDWNVALEDYYLSADLAADLSKRRAGVGENDISQQEALELVGWNATNDIYRQAAEALLGDFNAAVPANLSSAHYSTFISDASGGTDLGSYSRFVVDQRGFDVLANHLASKYLGQHDPRLILSSPIVEVQYTAEDVVVKTKDSCYAADYVLCTFSLGVLQQAIAGYAPVKFTPDFPSWKEASIRDNVMGLYTKIFYQFKPGEVFWPRDVQTLFYASPTQKGWWPIWISLDFPGSPLEGSGIIFATMIWDESRQIEEQSDDETMQQGLEILQQMFPNVAVPQPMAFLYPRWSETPWAYGTYPAWATGYTTQAQGNLRANLGRLWFAGDATSAEYWGYLHGAYYEGQAAAEEVAACLNDGSCKDRVRYPDTVEVGDAPMEHEHGFQDPLTQAE